ncbi:MAG TPA: hypothetical protein VFV95_15105 [Vicinamibacterales bacterium]|nr:hypothetical protein [Vicinamibacterales bacterium]
MAFATAGDTCGLVSDRPVQGRLWQRLSCRTWGHHVDNASFRSAASRSRRCRCGAEYLAEDGTTTRVRHTLSCFLGHHTYERLTNRHEQHEYVCIRCGHPLLFHRDADPYGGRPLFAKKVRYLCGLLGHRVRRVASRNGFSEYACSCGHTFLKPDTGLAHVRHPLACVARGHYVRFVERRAGFAEYVCATCGHPFCFADPDERRLKTTV